MDAAQTIVCGNKVYRPVLHESLTDEDLRVAREELSDTPDTRKIALERLKNMLMDQDEFTPRTDDVYLLRFLRCRKFNTERALKTIREHYKFRKQHPDVFPSPSAVEIALRDGIFNFLPHRDDKGRAVFNIKFGLWDPDRVPYADFVAAGNLVAEYVLDNSVTQINGYVGIWDYQGFGMKHFVTFCSARHIKLLTCLMQDRFPARFKVAYCVNTPAIANAAWVLFKQMMKEKFRNRIELLGYDMIHLHQFIDPSILPVEYGGSMNSPDANEMAQRVLNKEQYTNYNRKFGFS